MISPISSGLAVYILTSSLVGIVQQWWLNRTHPVALRRPNPRAGRSRKNNSSRKPKRAFVRRLDGARTRFKDGQLDRRPPRMRCGIS